jgi:hypothetical protein
MRSIADLRPWKRPLKVSKSRVAITAGAVFLSAALAVSLFLIQSSKPITQERVFTWNCETAEYKPEIITITCADGGIFIEKIQWSNWDKKGATGVGTLSENLCQPNCAEGKRVTAPVNLTLSNLTRYKEKIYLRTLDITTSNGKEFPWGRANGFQYDVMEFAELIRG